MGLRAPERRSPARSGQPRPGPAPAGRAGLRRPRISQRRFRQMPARARSRLRGQLGVPGQLSVPGRPRAEAAGDGCVRHPEPPPGLRVGDALAAPGRGPLPAGFFQLAGPSPLPAGQCRRPAADRDVMPGRHVVLGQAQHRRDPPAREPQPPQHRDRDIPHHRVAGRVIKQHHAASRDQHPAIRLVRAQVRRLGHALQDRRYRRAHAAMIPEF